MPWNMDSAQDATLQGGDSAQRASGAVSGKASHLRVGESLSECFQHTVFQFSSELDLHEFFLQSLCESHDLLNVQSLPR